MLLVTSAAVVALPSLPSSFYGDVRVNGADVALGTIVAAWINGAKCAETASTLYNGSSVYSLDVPGDDPSTADIIEGGRPGETVVFTIGSGTVTSTPPGIDCGGTCSADFDYNTSVTLVAAASTGSTFTGWSGSGCSGTDTCVVTMSEARNVTAQFTLNTPVVVLKLLDSNSNGLPGGTAQYYDGRWKDIPGTTDATGTLVTGIPTTKGNVTFRMTYAYTSNNKTQNVSVNPIVVFQTGKVHSDTGTCTHYYAGGWRPFTQDMELLPGTYTFHFRDRTPDRSYKIDAGKVNHIH